jgi:hypothetical protein
MLKKAKIAIEEFGQENWMLILFQALLSSEMKLDAMTKC